MTSMARNVPALGLWIIACATSAQPAVESVTTVDASSVVDCRLGSQPRYVGLGQYRMFDNDVKQLSKAECDIRGGATGVASVDEARAPLAGWTDLATKGDAAAQNRVGQIYELGIGTEANAVEAGQWYRKAAASGNRSAATNLASLYERGLLRKPEAPPAKQASQRAAPPSKAKAPAKAE